MQKIGNITATATSDGLFTNGSVASGVSPTILDAAWFNTIQNELVAIVLAGGLTLDPANDAQVLAAINKLLAAKALLAGNVNQQFFVKDATADGHAVNLGQLNTGLGTRALLAGNVNQQFSAKDASTDGHVVNLGQLNLALGKKAGLNGNAQTDFYVRNNGETSAAVNNERLNFVLGNYAYKGGDAGQGFAVAGGTAANSAVAYGQFQAGTNGNGAWIKLPNGAQWCRQNLSIPAKTNVIWTYPAGFTAPPAVFITGINGDPAVWSTGVGASNAGIYNNNDSALNVNLLAIW